MYKHFFDCLVSPITEIPIKEVDGKLLTEDGAEQFEIKNDIACLSDYDNLSSAKKHEIAVFNTIHVQNIPYFHRVLFDNIIQRTAPYLEDLYNRKREVLRVVEMGGGEGHWASCATSSLLSANVYLCDLSLNALERAPRSFRRICADVTRPIFKKKSISLACFWVSLHHLEADEIEPTFSRIYSALEDGGIFLIFEPNSQFWLRQIMYRCPLKKDVYPDERERALNFYDLSEKAKRVGFSELETAFMNPRYNVSFVKKLEKWPLYYLVVQFLYYFDLWFLNPLCNWLKCPQIKRFFSLYGFSIYRKERL